MQTVTDVLTMRKSDAARIASGTTGCELMLRAAKGIMESHSWRGRVAIVCGSGNNAGDGYALATLLHEADVDCTVYLLSERTSPDGAFYLEQCRRKKIKIEMWSDAVDLSEYTELVDCILGTGFCGTVTEKLARVIEAINQSGCFVISADINSGLNGDSGMGEICVHSNLTVSVGTLKSGLLLGNAPDVIERLVNVNIGIPILHGNRYLCEAGDFKNVLRARRHNSHKGNFGYVSILGGCPSYAGAVKLANLSCSALRAGCGVAQLIVANSLAHAVAPYLLESTLATLPDRDGHMLFDPQALDRVLAKQAALAIGMGWGKAPENAQILTYILQNYDIPIVIDADGLNALAETERTLLQQTRCQAVLTPHMGEMARLCGRSIAEIAEDPLHIAERFAKENGVVLLLKGACTVVTDGETSFFVNRGCAGMATAGSGDVLSGILAGLLGFCPPTPLTVACGAYIAGYAGELAQRDVNAIGMLASDTVNHIAEAVGELMEK